MAAIRIMTNKRFASYKKHLSKKVEEKRAQGKDWIYLTSFIANYLAFDCRYALTGKQIRELLSMATNDIRKENEEDDSTRTERKAS